MASPEHEEEGFFRDLKNLCEKRLLPQAKRAWHELKKGGSDFKNTITSSQSQMRQMKTKLTDKWERSEKKKKTSEAISKAAETGEEWAQKSMENIEETAKEWQPHVETGLGKVKEKFKRSKKPDE